MPIDFLHVKVMNPEEMQPPPAEATVPEHYVASSFNLPATGPIGEGADTNLNVPTEILPLALNRVEAIVSFNGTGQIVLCHSNTQAQSLQQGNPALLQQLADEGCVFTCPSRVRIRGTAPLWAVP